MKLNWAFTMFESCLQRSSMVSIVDSPSRFVIQLAFRCAETARSC